jgi:copper transporter 1
MLWNWYTIDACFLARSWKITSTAMFAGSCVGIICLVMMLYLLRRLQKEYELSIFRSYLNTIPQDQWKLGLSCRLSPLQIVVRAFLDTCQMGLAFIIMLLAMYFNGYIFISILVGGFLGSLAFGGFNLGAG